MSKKTKELSYRQLSENFINSKSEKDYNVLYQRVKPGLRNYIANVVKDNEATDDILTNTLTKMWTKIDQYDPKYQITTWLYRIAFNECLGWIRQRNTKYSLDAMKEYGIEVDPAARIHNLSVGQQQRVEIVRCLLQDPKLLIMDEPTSVLTPQETEQLFEVLRRFAENGLAVLFISHKLDEIRALTSRATVLRRGQNVGSVNTKGQSNRQLAELMIGTKVKDVARQKAPAKSKFDYGSQDILIPDGEGIDRMEDQPVGDFSKNNKKGSSFSTIQDQTVQDYMAKFERIIPILKRCLKIMVIHMNY